MKKTAEIPYFEVNSDFFNENTNVFAEGPIKDLDGFYKRIYDFVSINLKSDKKDNILCYLVSPAGIMMEATLDSDSYLKSLNKCILYYKKTEEYEKCNKIKKLIEIHGL